MTCLAAPLLTCSLAFAMPTDTITTGSLVREMIDFTGLSAYPEPSYRTIQFSSYDRSSTAPYAPGWYANSDGFGGEPIPNFLAVLDEPNADGIGRYLMAQVDGPGAIVRTWTAMINGTCTVYLDGSKEPVYDGPADEFLQYTYSHFAQKLGLIDGRIEDGFHQMMACYFPVPFAKSLRIEWTGNIDQLHFYHIETRLYPEGTRIATFTPEDVEVYADDIDAVLPVLADTDANWAPAEEGRVVSVSGAAEAGERAELLRIEEAGAVQELTLSVEADDLVAALRQVILKIHFDGAPHPQVESPLGDFFGSGPGLAPYDSLPMTVRADGSMTCRFVMPFASSCVIVVDNRSEQAATVRGHINVAPRPDLAETVLPGYATAPMRAGRRPMHFFAKWRVDHDLLAGGGDLAFDLPYLMAQGKGVFVGAAAMLMNPSDIPTSGGNWWGEGDEKIWVDGEDFPSLFGTGSEDYYNYAWSWPTLFANAYCAQPLDTGPDNRGFCANNRWHILDALPFGESFAFFMELFHHTPTPGLTYARAAYFYAYPDVRDDVRPIQTADVTKGLQLPENWIPRAAGAARGATFYQAEDCLLGAPGNATVTADILYSAGRAVLWTPSTPGEEISFRVEVPQAGRYQIGATFVHSPSSGRVTVVADGVASPAVADLYTPHLTMLRTSYFEIGEARVVELQEGSYTITLRAEPMNEQSSGSDIGVDFLWLQRRD